MTKSSVSSLMIRIQHLILHLTSTDVISLFNIAVCAVKLMLWPVVCLRGDEYGAPFVKILYLTDLAQKLLSLRIFSYLCAHLAMYAKCTQR